MHTASRPVALVALIVVLGAGGHLLTSRTIRSDRKAAASQRAQVETVHTQEVLARARAFVAGLAGVLASERQPSQARFARWAAGTGAAIGLDDVLWVQTVGRVERGGYERRLGAPITRLTPAGRFERAPAARSYLAATYTSRARPELRPGVEAASFPVLADALGDRASIFAVTASRPGSLGAEPGFFLLEAASFGRGPDSRGFLVAFVPRGWFTTTLGGDPRGIAISQGGRPVEGDVASPDASTSFDMLGRRWRIDVEREPPSGLQSTLPWLALAWPLAVAAIVYLVAHAVVLRRRAQGHVERIFELSNDLLAVIDLDGRYRRVNPAFERTLGYPPREMLSRSAFDFVHPDDREGSRAAFAELLQGRTVTQVENRFLCADGSECWLEWNAAAVLEQGVIYGIGRDVTERRRIDAEQAALRRVATLVAQRVPSTEVFGAVAREVAQVTGSALVQIQRYEPDDTVTVAGAWGAQPHPFQPGTKWSLEGSQIAARIKRTGSAVRIDDFGDGTGPIQEGVRKTRIRGGVGAPIVVEGELWGVMAAGPAAGEPVPAGLEDRLAEFTELVATAIANAESRAELRLRAEEQAALRRVATLVAQGVPADELLAAVAREIAVHAPTEGVHIYRYDPDGSAVAVAVWTTLPRKMPLGTRHALGGYNLPTLIYRTRRAARIDDTAHTTGGPAEVVERLGVRSAVGSPIVVEGRLWGAVVAATTQPEPIPADAEQRIAGFTELVATAIANADTRAQLAASRARVVAATTEERRRIVRDLHDGAQQRLVHAEITLQLALRELEPADGRAEALVREALSHASAATSDLRELVHGILPRVLTRGGLRAGVNALAARSFLPVTVDVGTERYPSPIEATAYFVVSEALTNAVKHSSADSVAVTAGVEDGVLRVEVRDDGAGGADPERGSGLTGLRDRVEALGGSIEIASPAGAGTAVIVRIPVRDG